MPIHDPVPPRLSLDKPETLQIIGGPNGCIIDMSPGFPLVVVAGGCIDARYFNLFRATSVVHIALKQQLDVLDSLIVMCEANGDDHYVPALQTAQNAINIARKIAQYGIERVSAEIQRNGK